MDTIKAKLMIDVKDVVKQRNKLLARLEKEMKHPQVSEDGRNMLDWVIEEINGLFYIDEVD